MKKDISYLIVSNLKIKSRTDLFFGSWNYYSCIYLPEAHVLRKLDHDSIDSRIHIRREWASRSINFGGSWNYRSVPITNEIVSHLHTMCDFLLGDETPKKIVVHSNHLYIYTNDPSLFDRLSNLGAGHIIEKVRVDLVGTPGTVCLKNPNHKLRTYLRNIKLDHKRAESVYAFLTNQESLRLSPSLKSHIDHKWLLIQPYLFFDHDDPGVLTMLNMIEPALIRKTVPITGAK